MNIRNFSPDRWIITSDQGRTAWVIYTGTGYKVKTEIGTGITEYTVLSEAIESAIDWVNLLTLQYHLN